ncbi:sulfatase [Cephaloticoccus primus]|uniref:Sulfatase n=1 Tax=Cephaloticoccus primus TaxID=1548207 RepID=A0A139SRD0_9BACT|nr:sulfatase-like hydrolase/transferase [Cephaloticoccus primus]KXU37118.1 sulfatase [Cephaloticoccus primus]
MKSGSLALAWMPDAPPNILWILTTQWRAQACGFAGDPNARTPHLDVLAAQSVNYTRAVTPHPFGPFARAALLTGIPSPQNGVARYYDPLPPGARTIAHELGARGYHTAFFGKWHLAARDPAAPLVGEAHARMRVPPEARGGFAFWEGFESGFLLNDPWLHGTRLPEPQRFSGYQSEILCTRAAEYLREYAASRGSAGSGDVAEVARAAAPWFAVLSLEAPHPPYAAAANGFAPLPPGQIQLAPNVPRGGAVEQRARRELSGYYAHIAATDAAIGRLLSGLPRENTVIVFTSVHGDMHGAHGLFRKGWPHEESVRVPLLVRHPLEPPRRDTETAASLLDLHRMTCAWARGERWLEQPERAQISMPSVVGLPDQCDHAWSGFWGPGGQVIFNADGSLWELNELGR